MKIAIALREFAVLGGAGHIVRAADEIVPVLAVVGAGDRVETRLEAELVAANKCVPVGNLGEGMAIGITGTVRVADASQGVTLKVGSVWVKFTTGVGGTQADPGVVNKADYLDVSRSFGPLQTGNGASRDETSSVVWLGAVRDDFSFNVPNSAIGVRRAPQTKVVRPIEN